MNQYSGQGPASTVIELAARPLRIYAPFMLVGAVCSAVVALWLLAHSWSGVDISAEGLPGTAITMPAVTGHDLEVYAVRPPGPRPDVTCNLTTTSSSWVGMNFGMISPKSDGRVLEPVAKVFSGWHKGDTLTCTGDGVKTVVLGRNVGLTYLLQGLMATFLALGSGLFALVGFSIRRHKAILYTGPAR